MALQPLFPLINLTSPALQYRISALWRAPIPLFGLPALSIPLLDSLPRPSSILQDIWDGILRAVPKKKTSKSKTRSRQMAGKALKDLTAIVKCSSCGKPKRAHYLCPYCVYAVQLFWKKAWKQLGTTEEIATTKSSNSIDLDDDLTTVLKEKESPGSSTASR